MRIAAQRHVLSNGLVALIQQTGGAPTVSVRGEVRWGARDEPPEQNGLAVFAGAALIRGTARRSFQQITAEVEERGAAVGAGGGMHATSFSGRALAEDLPLVLDILADMVIRPVFPEAEIERLRGQFLMSLRESAQETRYRAQRTMRSLIFPPEHPYSRLSSGTPETVAAIRRDDLVAFQQHYHPARTTIAIVGDIDPVAALQLLDATFGGWQPGPAMPVAPPPPPPRLTQAIQQTISMAGKVQTDLIWAMPGLARTAPEYYAAMLANYMLGQMGMGGRLGDTVRDQQGLAYSVGSTLEADLGAGPWSVAAGVNPASVPRALSAIRAEIERFRADGPDEDELRDARASLTSRVVLGLETNDGIAGTLLAIERYGLGLDYIARYRDIIHGISRDDLVETARRYLDLERSVLVIAGPEYVNHTHHSG